MKKTKDFLTNQRGITLIALIITIIVMLLLAIVVVRVSVNDNGVIKRANDAKDAQEMAQEKEYIDTVYSSIKIKKMSQNDNTKLTARELEDEINNTYGAGTVTVTGDDVLEVTWLASNRKYEINQSQVNTGDNGIVDFDKIFETATKPEGQTKNAIGVAEDGSIVNLDLWSYTKKGTEYYIGENYYIASYSNDNIKDGKIQGKVPMYIKEDGDENYYPVTNMSGTFFNCSNLTVAPEIPSTVKTMYGTFFNCSNLTVAPEIPSTVTNMNYTFRNCKSLENPPLIIPENVTSMSYTFDGCSALTGEIKFKTRDLDSNGYAYVFNGVGKKLTLYLLKGSPIYTKLSAIPTYQFGTNISIEQYDEQ